MRRTRRRLKRRKREKIDIMMTRTIIGGIGEGIETEEVQEDDDEGIDRIVEVALGADREAGVDIDII